MGILYKIYRLLGPQTRHSLKRWVGGLGHGASVLDSLKASKDALGKRRLDEAFCHFLKIYSRLQNKSLSGLRCIDFGAGYVISDSLVMWLLGAHCVETLDYNAIANSEALRKAVLAVDEARLFGCAKSYGFIDMTDLKERLGRLRGMAQRGNLSLEALNIRYRAPFDATDASQIERLQPVDLIWSTSVLEHIHPQYMEAILSNLTKVLSPWGGMVHLVDARDHLDLDNAPFGFFDADTDYVLDQDFDARGNRLMLSDWTKIAQSTVADGVVVSLDSQFNLIHPEDDVPAPFYLLMIKNQGTANAHPTHH